MLHPESQYCTRSDIFELTPLDEKIDFSLIGRDGGNIFKCCLDPAIQLTRRDDIRAVATSDKIKFLSRNTTSEQSLAIPTTAMNMIYQQSLIAPTIEDRFFKLVAAAERYGYNTDAIMEKPDYVGSTVFETATIFSVRICKYILSREIRVNNILTNLTYPVFHPTSEVIWEKMLQKGINPKVISVNIGISTYDGRKPQFDGNPKLKKLIKKFNRSVYFSNEDILCPEWCPPKCKTRMRAFYLNNGPMVRMIAENQIGKGGFGNVFKGKWHGEKVAFKCVQIDLGLTAHRETEQYLDEHHDERGLCLPQFLRFQKETEEFSKPFSLSGPGILQPIAFFRQQDQYNDGERTRYGNIWWKARNYNVYVYPLYDCNLYELHNNFHDILTDQTLEHILSQCLTSLYTLRQNSTTHNDIKPQNFLVRFHTKKCRRLKNLMQTKIMLTDFGLANVRGGTPIFASPEEGLISDTVGKILLHRKQKPLKSVFLKFVQ